MSPTPKTPEGRLAAKIRGAIAEANLNYSSLSRKLSDIGKSISPRRIATIASTGNVEAIELQDIDKVLKKGYEFYLDS